MIIMENNLDSLLRRYLEGELDTESFTSNFTTVFNLETDYDQLSKFKDKLYSELASITARYSSNQDEIDEYKVHYSEGIVREKAKEVWKRLNE
jgi:hypothetical protein